MCKRAFWIRNGVTRGLCQTGNCTTRRDEEVEGERGEAQKGEWRAERERE